MNSKQTITQFVLGYMLMGFVNSFRNDNIKQWSKQTRFDKGDIVINEYLTDENIYVSNKYVCMKTGESGVIPPTHSGKGLIRSDGDTSWLYLETEQDIDIGLSNLYVTFGKSDKWDDNDTVPLPEINANTTPTSISNIIYANRLDKNYISLVAKRNKWESGRVYDEFTNESVVYTNPYYITNSQGCIYFCLYNANGSPSEVEPTGESVEPITTLDGYLWYYVAKIDIDKSKFYTDNYIPLNKDTVFNPHLSENNGGIAALKFDSSQIGMFEEDKVESYLLNYGDGYDAQINGIVNTQGVIEKVEIKDAGTNYSSDTKVVFKKKDETGSGAEAVAVISNTGTIDDIKIINGGADYKNAVIIIDGDGIGARAVATVAKTGLITDIKVTSKGSGYTKATIYIVAGESALVSSVKLLPYNNTLTDIISAFVPRTIMLNMDITASNAYFPHDTEYREVMLVLNLYDKATQKRAKHKEYIGASHPSYDKQNQYNKLHEKNGVIIYRKVSEKLIHVDNQSEMVNLVITF